jgi:hypothetical protein
VHCILRDKEGFVYLNSKKCMEVFDRIKATERQLIEFSEFYKNELIRIYNLFHKEHDTREYGMLQNLYKYTNENDYNQAVFLLGYAHRKSMKQKIKEYKKTEMIQVNWTFFQRSTLKHKNNCRYTRWLIIILIIRL